MQKSTTIIRILEMIEDGFTYTDIRNRYSIGNSVITDLKYKLSNLNLSLNEIKSKDPQTIEQLFYGRSHLRKDVPLPDFETIYMKLTDKKSHTNLYFEWTAYKMEFPNGYQYTQFKEYFKRWMRDNHLGMELRMVVERIPGEIVYIDWIGIHWILFVQKIPMFFKLLISLRQRLVLAATVSLWLSPMKRQNIFFRER